MRRMGNIIGLIIITFAAGIMLAFTLPVWLLCGILTLLSIAAGFYIFWFC